MNRIIRSIHSLTPCALRAVLLSLALLPVSAHAVDRFVTVTGAGTMSGLDWQNAYSKAKVTTDNVLNAVLLPGDTLYIGSGNYGAWSFNISTSGTSTSPKKIVGVDLNGGGKPIIDSNNWNRELPGDNGNTQYIFYFGTTAASSYWEISNLVLGHAEKVINASDAFSHPGLVFKNLDITYCQHAFFLQFCDNLLIDHCTVAGYSKHAFRLEKGCDNVTFNFCTADQSNGDPTWWDWAEAHPYGFFISNLSTANTNVAYNDCIAKNNLNNRQLATDFWNGDGFVSENNTVGLSYTRCIALNNEDGGFDVKQAAGSTTTFTDCVAVGNGNNFKAWYYNVNFTNCVASFARRRGPSSSNDINGLRIESATVTADKCTFHGSTGTESGVAEKNAGTATISNSIISFTGSTGNFKTGTVTLTNTATYRPGSGIDPRYVNPVSTWDGIGIAMNSLEYNTLKGYYIAGGPSPVAHWKLDETTAGTAADASGNGNTGTAMNGPVPLAGHINNCLQFDGTNDCVSIANSPSVDLTKNFTIAAWVRPDVVIGGLDKTIMAKAASGNSKQYQLMITAAAGAIYFGYETGGNNYAVAGGTATANVWQHVAVTVDSSRNIKVYLGGSVVANGTAPAEATVSTVGVAIGRNTYSSYYYFDGNIDDVRIYNTALSDTEVAALAGM